MRAVAGRERDEVAATRIELQHLDRAVLWVNEPVVADLEACLLGELFHAIAPDFASQRGDDFDNERRRHSNHSRVSTG